MQEVLTYLLKFLGSVLLLTLVWFASGEYQKRNFRSDFDEVIQVRVRNECLRPDWIHTSTEAREFDVTVREVDLISNRMDLLNRRTAALLDHADRVEALRQEMVQSRLPSTRGGVGGPAPTQKKP